MRVFFILNSSEFRGAEQVLADSLVHLAKRVEVHVLCSSVNGVAERFTEIPGVQCSKTRWFRHWGSSKGRFPIVGIFLKFASMLMALPKILAGVWKADVVFGNNSGDVLFAPFARILNKPFVVEYHDDVFPPIVRRFIRLFNPLIRTHVACSWSVQRALLDLLPGRDDVVVLENGLDDLPPPPSMTQDEGIAIAWIGTMEERKDPEEFVRLIQAIHGYGLSVTGFMYFHTKSADLEAKVRRMVADEQVPVKFIGKVKREEIHAELGKYHWLALTSKSDPLPTVIIESYRARIPVICNRLESLEDMVEDGVSGLVYDRTEHGRESVARRLQSMDRGSLCVEASKVFQQRFSLSTKVNRLETLLKEAGR